MNGILAQHRSTISVGVIGLVVLALVAFLMLHAAQQPEVHTPPPVTIVTIQPQKPPPPPPPPPQQKIIVQPKMTVPEPKPMIPNQPPKAAPPKAAAPASTHMGTSIHNNGPADAFNLNGTPGGNGMLDGGGGGGAGSRWGYYASVVTSQIQSALQNNPKTRNASAGLRLQIYADASGLIDRVVLVKSSGNPAIDQVIEDQVLMNMRLSQPPPSDMPMPINISLTGQEPL